MKRLLFVLWAIVLAFTIPLQAASPVVISEFMADNTRTLFDEDGDSEDWIELHNVGTNNVNLSNWALTDSPGNLTKWRLPATNLNVGTYMIVFASGKDRRVPGRPLHTSFKLSPDGDYLALVEPDGLSIATAFQPQYPVQVPNVSFGFGLMSSNTSLIGTGAAVRVLVPTTANGGSSLGQTWTGGAEPFADGGWRSGVSGVGFSVAGAPELVGADAMTVRFNFDAPPVGTVILDTKPVGNPNNGVNSGATWVASSTDNSPTPIARSGVMSFSTLNNSQISLAGNAIYNTQRGTFSFWMKSLGFAAAGQGPAVVIDRQTVTAVTLTLGGLLTQTEDGRLQMRGYTNGVVANSTVTTSAPSDDRWHHIAVVYDQTAAGSVAIFVDGVLDNSVTNSRGWGWPGTAPIELGRSHEPTFRKYNGQLDDFRIYNRQLTADEVVGIYSGDGGVPPADLGTEVSNEMLNINGTAFLRLPFNISDPNAFSLLTLRVRHNDGFVAWLNGRLVAQVHAPDPLSWDSSATTPHSSSLADSVTFGNPPGLLRTGANILAIQGLNVSPDDPTFLILPELSGSSVPVESSNGLYFTQPTPGAPNTGGTTSSGPAITEVSHVPNVPTDSEDVRVSARIQPTFNAISAVALRYRIMYATEVTLPMNDTGSNGDLVAGDGIWSGLIPASASTNGQMIRYYVSALDTSNNVSKWPLFYSPTNSEQYLGTIVEVPTLTSKLPIYHLFLNPSDQAGADGENGARCSIFYDGEFYDNVRIELRGNTSASFRKKAHRIEFNRDHRFRHLEGYPRVGDTSFLGESADPAYMRHMHCFWLADAMGVPSPFNYPVRLQLNTAFYQLALHSDVMGMEQLERMGYDPQGALYKAIGNLVPGGSSTGGFEKKTRLYEDRADYLSLANGIAETQSLAARTTNLFDMVDVPNVVNYLAVARWVQEADDVWANMTIYRDTLGDQLWRIIPFDMNVSWGQLYCGDNPSVFGQLIATNDIYKAHPLYGGSTVPVQGGGAGYNRMYDVIIAVPQAREMLLRRMRSMLDDFIQPPNTHPMALQLESRLLSFSNSIHNEAILDRLRWGWENSVLGGSPAGPYCFGTNQWLTNHLPKIFSEFLTPRRQHWYGTHCITNTARAVGIATVNNAGIPTAQPANATIDLATLDYNPASHNQAEEYICLTNPNPYAVDISGWKLGGGIDFTFKGGTVLGSNRVLYVSPDLRSFRTRSVAPKGGMGLLVVGPYQGQLSARGEPLTITDQHGRLVYTNVFQGEPSAAQRYLRITELMYNPPATAGNPTDAQEFEYIELRNTSTTTTVDLTGVRFLNGITFDFTGSTVTSLAPGQRVLIVKNQAAFTARYGAVSVAGQYTGSLDNAGERLQMVDAVNEEILDFGYNNSWYPITDGLGFSLVISNELAETDAWGHREGWRPSLQLNGAPGQTDPPPAAFPGVLVSEVLAHTDLPQLDAIELFNPTASPVNLAGWYLSDDFDVPKKYRITEGSVIAAGGYLSFSASLFNQAGIALIPFALSSKGDTVWLFSGDAAGNLTGYVFGEDFGASASGVSLGRYTNSVGTVHFVAQSANTLGTANTAPLVGPVVLSEIMYHPVDGPGASDNSDDEFVALQNITGAPVVFYDLAAPANTWRIRGGIDYEFPTGLSVPANGTVLVVSFDTNEVRKLAAFRTRYNVPAAVPVFGPYRGKLDNSADNVRLERPDAPEQGEVPFVLVDRVEYADSAPWPVLADGTGASLQRRTLSTYGNDPANWTATAPRAGGTIPSGTAPTITAPPANATALAGSSATFNVTATGTAPLSYQWRYNSNVMVGATSASLVLNGLRVDQAGLYSVTVFNAAGSITSSDATLTVALPAFITSQPANVTLRGSTNAADYGYTTNKASFSVVAVGSGVIRYQWIYNEEDIPGATASIYTIDNVGLTNEGFYAVRVSDAAGSIQSRAAQLKVLVSPTFLQAPGNLEVPSNSSFSASVVIRGNPPPYRFEWREISTIRGATNTADTTNFFTSAPVTNTTARAWRLIVSNEANPAGLVSTFNVTAIPDTDGDGIPDSVETNYGFDPNNNADRTLDADGDGVSNSAEFQAGTDPLDPLSYLKVQLSVPNAALITFIAQSNKTYSVQYNDRLGSGNAWSRLIDVIAQPATRSVTVTDPASNSNRFYRLTTPHRP